MLTQHMVSAARASKLFVRNWSFGEATTFAIYEEDGEAFIGTVTLTPKGWQQPERGTIRERSVLTGLCALANGTAK